jgi:hypothetical protein
MSARNVGGEVILSRLATREHGKIPAVQMIEKWVTEVKFTAQLAAAEHSVTPTGARALSLSQSRHAAALHHAEAA